MFQTISPQSATMLQKYQALIKEGTVEKDISNSFWKNASATWSIHRKCHALLH
jgi:hypothetical protein